MELRNIQRSKNRREARYHNLIYRHNRSRLGYSRSAASQYAKWGMDDIKHAHSLPKHHEFRRQIAVGIRRRKSGLNPGRQ